MNNRYRILEILEIFLSDGLVIPPAKIGFSYDGSNGEFTITDEDIKRFEERDRALNYLIDTMESSGIVLTLRGNYEL